MHHIEPPRKKVANGVARQYALDHFTNPIAHDPGWPYAKIRGYGTVLYDGRNWKVHRLAWTLAHGPIPPGLVVRHTCNTPRCFWIEHLRIGTQADNMADRWAEWLPTRRYGPPRPWSRSMRKTRSDPIQFRLLLDDYAVLERAAAEQGMSPKDFVIDLTLKRVASERRKKRTADRANAATSAAGGTSRRTADHADRAAR